MKIIIFLLFTISFFYLTWKRIHQYLRFLQQEEYDPKRFLNWVIQNKFLDRKASLSIVTCSFVMLVFGNLVAIFLLTILLPIVISKEPDPVKVGKIKLKLTQRAKRIRNLGLVLQFIAFIVSTFFLGQETDTALVYLYWLTLIIIVQLQPFFLALSVKILQPGEDRLQKKLLDEAKEKFKAANIFTIGITGSFGKTSSKNMLGSLLNTSLAPTFWPEKGINTPMGITREIREKLSNDQKYAVVEMGAYRPGSIKRLCELTPPNAGIITAVGRMHLDRMGGDDGVFKAKSELAQAIPTNGILVCNADNEGARRIALTYPKATTILTTLQGNVDLKEHEELCVLTKLETTPNGTKFKISFRDKDYQGFLAMHGMPALSNFCSCFAMCCALGADANFVLAAARNLKAVNNRLEVVVGNGYTQINDAYNSNPQGFIAALEVLKELPGKRKILVTPGMIELGDKQKEENAKVARFAATVCEQIYLVSEENSRYWQEALKEVNFPEEQVTYVKNRTRAFELLANDKKIDDVVLLENDLPDLFELDVKL